MTKNCSCPVFAVAADTLSVEKAPAPLATRRDERWIGGGSA